GSQLSSVHPLLSSQFRGGPPTHSPSLQVSSVVQALPSSQGSVFGTWRQPSCASQLSSVQPLWSSHEGAVPGVHWLPTQISKPSQRLPLSQSPSVTQQFGMGVCWQPTPASQESAVQSTRSSQSSCVPFWQPAAGSQVSAPSQTLPLSQSRRRWLQMCCSTSQLSVVQRS